MSEFDAIRVNVVGQRLNLHAASRRYMVSRRMKNSLVSLAATTRHEACSVLAVENRRTMSGRQAMSEHEQVTGMLSAKNQAPIELDPGRTALVIVDMQRYFTQPSFPFTDLFEKMSPGVCSGYLRRVRESVIPNIRLLLDHFRKAGSLIVFTAVGTETKDGSDLA